MTEQLFLVVMHNDHSAYAIMREETEAPWWNKEVKRFYREHTGKEIRKMAWYEAKPLIVCYMEKYRCKK